MSKELVITSPVLQSLEKVASMTIGDGFQCMKLILILLTISSFSSLSFGQSMTVEQCKQLVEQVYKDKLPKKVDEYTTRKSVVCVPSNYKLSALVMSDYLSDQFSDEQFYKLVSVLQQEKTTEKMISANCSSPPLREILKSNDLIYKTYAKNKLVKEVKIKESDCGK